MKTVFHDVESGIKLEVEGTFANSKAQLVDDEGNVTTELEGSYSEILEMISQLSVEEDDKGKEELREACEDNSEDKENITTDDFRGAKVKVLEDITDEYDDTLDKGTITTDVNVLDSDNIFIDGVFIETNDFKKLEILADEQKNIQPDELFVVNNDEMEYCLGFEKGEIVKFLFHEEDNSLLVFRNSEGIDQAVKHEDVTLLENQDGNKLRFNFCYENDILLTEDTSLKGTKVNLTKHSVWIEDDESLVIHTDCDDGIPYIVSAKSGNGAFIGLSELKLRKEEDAPSLKVGDSVKVREGKEYSGVKGFAIVTDISEDDILLKGISADGRYSEVWFNNRDNVDKIN